MATVLDKENIIIELAKEKKIELYIPNRDKVPRNHFRVVDGKSMFCSVYSEKEHKAEDEKRYYERFDNLCHMALMFEKAFDNIIDNSTRQFAEQ